METRIGGVINKFKGKSRRSTLFFEDILAIYIRTCELAGEIESMERIGLKWGALGTKQLGTLRIFHSIKLLNHISKSAWTNIGLMDDFKLSREGDIIRIRTRNEFISRIIGKNHFMPGVFEGCLASYFGREMQMIKIKMDIRTSEYSFRITNREYQVESRDKDSYNKSNVLSVNKGFVLRKAIKSRMFQLKKDNRIFFRGRSLIPIENTIIHIIGNENVLTEKISLISHDFFERMVEKASSPEKKLNLLKTILQVTGWCTIRIMQKKNGIIFRMDNLPSGLQKEKDNWKFLIEMIEGYLWLIDRKYKIESAVQKKSSLYLSFSKSKR